MSTSDSHKYQNDPEFQAILVSCLEMLERGETLDRTELLSAHPRFAKPLAEFLDDQQHLRKMATELRDSVVRHPAHVAATLDSNPKANGFGPGAQIRYIGEFEVLEEIARGGMGVVFRARQQRLHRIVALKMILAGRLADISDVERFQREARSAAQLKHPHIVSIHEVGEHDGYHYFTMDYVDGHSLAEEIRDESLAPARAATIVRLVADAIHYAHERGTLHRDLKPANILLDAADAPHVTDFGLAKLLESGGEETHAELTASGQILGTPSYMSPEQAAGKNDLVGPATDIYSLGAILYACLTGRAPFVADSTVDTLMQVIRNEPVAPRSLTPGLPRDLETICLKCLEKEAHKRYGTAGELADDLANFLAGRPVTARPIGPVAKSWRWCRRNPVVAGLLSLLMVSLLVGTVVSTWFGLDATQHAAQEAALRVEAEGRRAEAILSATDAEKAQADLFLQMQVAAKRTEEAENQRQRAEDQLENSNWLSYALNLSAARGDWQLGATDRAWSRLQRTPERFRGWEYDLLATQFDGNSQRIKSSSADDMALSSDGSLLVTANPTGTGGVRVLDVATGEVLNEFECSPLRDSFDLVTHYTDMVVAISPDGRFVAASGTLLRGDGPPITVWDRQSGKTIIVLRGHVTSVVELAFDKTGQRLISRSLPKGYPKLPRQVKVWDWQHRVGETTLDTKLITGGRLSLTRSGHIQMLRVEDQQAIVSDQLAQTTLATVEPFPDEPLAAVGYRDNLEQMAIGTKSGRVQVWDLANESLATEFQTNLSNITELVFLSPARLLIVNTRAGGATVHLWDLEQHREIDTYRGHAGAQIQLLAHADERRFLTLDSQTKVIRIWDTQPQEPPTIKVPASVSSLVLSSDGELLVATAEATLYSFRLPTREPIQEIQAPGEIRQVALAPDAGRVALVLGRSLACYELASGQSAWKTGLEVPGKSVAYSRDGRQIYVGDVHGKIVVVDAADGTVGKSLWNMGANRLAKGPTIHTIAVPSQGELIAAGAEYGKIAFIDPRNGEATKNLKAPKRYATCSQMVFDPTATFLAATFNAMPYSGVAKVWRVNQASELASLSGHSGPVTDIAFHPAGERIATTSWDRTIRIWNTHGGQPVLTLEQGDNLADKIVFSRDGRTLISGHRDGTIQFWEARPSPRDEARAASTDSPPSKAASVAAIHPIRIALRANLDGTLRSLALEEKEFDLDDEPFKALRRELEANSQNRDSTGIRIWADPYLKYGSLREALRVAETFTTTATEPINLGLAEIPAPPEASRRSILVVCGGKTIDQYTIPLPPGKGPYFLEHDDEMKINFARQPALLELSRVATDDQATLAADGKVLGRLPSALEQLAKLVAENNRDWNEHRKHDNWFRHGTHLHPADDVMVSDVLQTLRTLRVTWSEQRSLWLKFGDDIALDVFVDPASAER